MSIENTATNVAPVSQTFKTEAEEMAWLRSENARMKAEDEARKAGVYVRKGFDLGNGLSAQVSEKGAISIYGMGRFPLTLYRSQFERLAPCLAQIHAFIQKHAAELKEKQPKPKEVK